MSSVRTRLLPGVLILAGVGAVVSAAAQLPTFRSGVDLVALDVSVFDARGEPVAGLTAQDFTVLEDGRPQTIRSFEEIVAPAAELPRAAWLTQVTPDVQTNAVPDTPRLFVILMDDATMPVQPQFVLSAKTIAHGIVDRMGPSDLGSVIFTRGNARAQEFTADPARLREAIDSFTFGSRNDLTACGDGAAFIPCHVGYADTQVTLRQFFMAPLSILEAVSRTLADVTGRRKTIAYISFGVPIDHTSRSGSRYSDLHLDLEAALQAAVASAARSNVNIYAFDPGGLDGMSAFPNMPPAVGNRQVSFLQTMAESTGGRAVVNTNEFADGLDRLFRENERYYLIGFESDSRKPADRLRLLQVRVNRPGIEVRTRTGYYPPAPPDRRGAPRVSALAKGLEAVLPERGIPLRVSALAFDSTAGPDAAVALTVAVESPARPGQTAVATDLVRVVVEAFDSTGARRATRSLTADLRVAALGERPVPYELFSVLNLRAGRYRLRVAADIERIGRVGTVFADVDVPDFRRDALTLSGLAIVTTPSWKGMPKDALKAWIPVAPTSRRVFHADDVVAAFVRVYQKRESPAQPVAVITELLDPNGRRVFSRQETIEAGRFNSSRSTDVEIVLPVLTLAQGPHLLAITADAGGRRVKRTVTFDRE